MTEHKYRINDTVAAQVVKIHSFGAVVRLPDKRLGLIHISQIADEFVNSINDYLKVGDVVTARVKKVSPDGKIDLTLKTRRQPSAEGTAVAKEKEFRIATLEEKLEEFLRRTAANESDGVRTVT